MGVPSFPTSCAHMNIDVLTRHSLRAFITESPPAATQFILSPRYLLSFGLNTWFLRLVLWANHKPGHLSRCAYSHLQVPFPTDVTRVIT